MLITVGSYVLLKSDSLTIYQKAVGVGVDVKLVDVHGMFHVYPIMSKNAPEGKQPWNASWEFMNTNLNER